jgi:hypothetical protein
MTHGLNSELYSELDMREIVKLSESDPTDLAMEIGILRMLIRRAGAVKGIDPVPVLDGVSSAADRLARVLKAQRVLKGEAAESMTAAIAAAVRELGEELGLGDGSGGP